MPTNQSTSTTSRRQQLQDRRAREAASQAKRRRAIRLATGLVATLIVALIGFGLWSKRYAS